MQSPYKGLTYPHVLAKKIIWRIWRGYFCKRNIHLFDEVWSDSDWYLSCDACGLEVHIKKIDETYVE